MGDGDGGLIGACVRGDTAAVRAILVAHPEEAHRRETRLGIAPLHFAAHRGHREIVRLLLDAGADVQAAEGAGGATPLHWAAEAGHAPVAELLLERGARLDVRDHFFELEPLGWSSAVAYAPHFHRDRAGTAGLLVERGARLDPFTAVVLGSVGQARRAPGWTEETLGPAGDREGALHFAVRDDEPQGITALRGVGADPGRLSARGVSSRALARHLGRERCLPALTELTGDLSWHVVAGDVVALEAALQASAGAVAPGGSHATLLHFAAEGHPAAIPPLLAHGADPGALWIALEWEELVGLRPLHVAARSGSASAAAALLAGGADVDQRTAGGCVATALHMAAARGHVDVVEVLLAAGADRRVRDSRHDATPGDWARDDGHPGLAARLA